MSANGRQARGSSIFAVALIGVLWGLNWPAVKFMLTELQPLTMRAVAFTLAAVLLAIIARVMGHSLRMPKDEIVHAVVTGALVIFGFNALTAFGQLLVQTSRAAIIAYTMPAMTAVLAAVFLGDRLDARLVAALVIGMAGLAVLVSENLPELAAAPAGPAIMALAALSWALGNVALKSRRWSLSPIALTVWFFVVSALLCWPLVLAFEVPWEQPWPSAPVLWALAYHVLGPVVVCYVVWTVLVGRLPATVAAISTLTAPVVGVVSAVVLLGDPLTWQKVLALALVVLSIAMTLAPPRLTTGEKTRGRTSATD